MFGDLSLQAFLKRILQTCGSHAPSFVCGCLILISEASAVLSDYWNLRIWCSSITNWQECLFELNNLDGHTSFPLVQVLKLRPGLWSFILQSESTDLEHFSDVVEETEKLPVNKNVSEEEQSGGGGHGNKGHQTYGGNGNKEDGDHSYIIDHRNPLHCGAENTCLWELERVRPHPFLQ